jgi:hypothetical protein
MDDLHLAHSVRADYEAVVPPRSTQNAAPSNAIAPSTTTVLIGHAMRADYEAVVPRPASPQATPYQPGVPPATLNIGRAVRFDFDVARTRPSGAPGTGLATRFVLLGVLLGVLVLGGIVLTGLGKSPAVPGTTACPSASSGLCGASPTAFATLLVPATPLASAPSFGPPLTATPTSLLKPTAAPTAVPAPTATARPKVTARPTSSPKPTIAFVLTPSQVNGSCKSGLAPFQLTLNNAKSNVAVGWSLAFAASAYPGDWGSAKPSSGQVPAGQVATVTITPRADLCSSIKGQTDFVLTIKYATGSASMTYTVTP